MKITSFEPILDLNTRVIILGSMPGARSLEVGQYYASPRNRFWPLMQDLLGLPPDVGYDERVSHLLSHGVGLWDVLKNCTRAGSLDSAIKDEEPNDFAELKTRAPDLQVLAFNGQKALKTFERMVGDGGVHPLPRLALPSTSPANAAAGYEKLVDQWRAIRRYM